VLRAFVFVPTELAASAYLDEPVALSHKQVTTQPSLVAKMVEALALRGHEKVLEVGTGYGYQTALLAMLAREVWSIELWQDMTDAARTALVKIGIGNATLLVGDGTRGLPEQAPLDAIIVTAAFPPYRRRWRISSPTAAASFNRSGPAAARTCACSRSKARSWW
jgi:protein-L-isoaspartate(D-aspartate) O-methyltransferase